MHHPLPSTLQLLDEGSANHTRFCYEDSAGVHLFVYGKGDSAKSKPLRFPARQTEEACRALQRLHQLPDELCVFAQQNPEVIDRGVFHNDVIATGHENLFLYHEEAFLNAKEVIEELQAKSKKAFKKPLQLIKITNKQLSVDEAVRSYFFNSQIITVDKKTIFIAPEECLHIKKVNALIHTLPGIDKVIFVPLSESMKNGGGPACLRMRLVLTEKELKHMHQGVILNDTLYKKLRAVIEKHYPEKFHLHDLLNANCVKQFHKAHNEVLKILKL